MKLTAPSSVVSKEYFNVIRSYGPEAFAETLKAKKAAAVAE